MKKKQDQQTLFNELYKKILILPFVFLLTACATPDNLIKENKIRSGMSKYDVDDVIIFRSFWNQIFIPEAYREYFPKEKKEILSGTGKHVYYVFRNVDTKVKCGWLLCEYGNGILDKTFTNYKDAVNYIVDDEKIAAKKEPKKTITITENNVETEVPDDNDTMKQLTKLMDDYKSGKISKEEFTSKKTEILK
tara:strand:- start:49 stop:624 length:576 start_codon:yes stop_codon:yes gene_type:complete